MKILRRINGENIKDGKGGPMSIFMINHKIKKTAVVRTPGKDREEKNSQRPEEEKQCWKIQKLEIDSKRQRQVEENY